MLLLRLGSPAPTHFCFHPHAPIAASGGLAAAPAGRCHAHAAGRSSPGPASALCSWRHRRLPRGGSGALQLSVVPGIAVNLRRQPGLRRARFDCTRARRPPRGARLAGREGQSPRSEARSAQDRSRAPSIITEVHLAARVGGAKRAVEVFIRTLGHQTDGAHLDMSSCQSEQARASFWNNTRSLWRR